jgi:hypothetical protein
MEKNFDRYSTAIYRETQLGAAILEHHIVRYAGDPCSAKDIGYELYLHIGISAQAAYYPRFLMRF